MSVSPRANLLRRRLSHEDHKVSFVELFFDLVFVFAITQLSHALLEDLTIEGFGRAALLLLAVWWVWIYTTWVTNWLDPQRTPVRLMLFVLMLAGLVLSTSIPEAFGERGLAFAVSYVLMQVGRCCFMLWALAGHSPGNFRNFQRITVWLAAAGPFWLAGGFVDGAARVWLWGGALLIEYVSPAVGFWTPRLGRSATTDWEIAGEHMAERCGLFIIIALGESILVAGSTFASLDWSALSLAAFITVFVGSVALWWLYFHIGAERGTRHIAALADPGRMGRVSYTYIHVLPVAGIIAIAVGGELVLSHPLGDSEPKTVLAVLGGPGLYIVGSALFKWTVAGRAPLSHIIGLVLLGALAPFAADMPPIWLAVGATSALVIAAIREARAYRPRGASAETLTS